MCKTDTKEIVVAEEISAIKQNKKATKNTSTLHNKKKHNLEGLRNQKTLFMV